MSNVQKTPNEQGSILVVTVLILVLLSIMGTASLSLTNIELLISRNSKLNTQSFFDAEAGVHYTLARIKILNQNGSSPLSSSNCTIIPGNPPGSFSFNASVVCPTASEDIYTFNSTGFSSDLAKSAKSIINVNFEATPLPVINFAAFGDTKLETKDSAGILSYNSNNTNINDLKNGSFNSTGEANIGSNEELIIEGNSDIDGNLVIGQNINGMNGTQEIGEQTSYSG
ncbi:MAG: hypothetical protein U5L00_08610 [Desulfovermiculus sp.]|nr:hypothetical protein [Desulfovermiculus sp.]